MSDPQLEPTRPESSTSWGSRVLRRTAAGLAAAVSFALVAPAIANAAGANVANPVVVALRGSVEAVSGAFESGADAPCTPLADASAPATPVDDTTDAQPRKKAKKAKKCAGASASASASAPAAAGEHGLIVSTVARCSPHGKDPLFAVTGDVTSHGAFVRAAAHGDTLALPFGSFDLSTQAGAESLCAALATQEASLPSPSAEPRGNGKSKAAKDKAAERSDKGSRGGPAPAGDDAETEADDD